MSDLSRVVPKGRDVVDDLTVAELDTIARRLKCDVIAALQGKGAEGVFRVRAMAHLALAWAKRGGDGDAKLETYLNMTAGDLGTVLGMDDDDDEEDKGDGGVPPTDDATASD